MTAVRCVHNIASVLWIHTLLQRTEQLRGVFPNLMFFI